MGKFPIIAYSYARISTKKQERGSGIQRQMKQSREYAARYGLVLDETLRDIGVSAFTGANVRKGALGRFLAMVHEGHIAPGSYLLIESLDRLSRDKVRLAMPIFLEIINAGIIIITLGDGDRRYDMETMDREPYLLMGSLVVMTRGNEESATKRFRTAKWWEAQIARARITPGFKVKGQNPPGWLNADWSRNEPTIEVVEKAFELAATGMGAHAIAKHLNEIGAPTLSARKRSGGGWYQSTLGGLLSDRRVLGEWQPTEQGSGGTVPEGPPILGYCEQVISYELFERVQEMRTPLNRAKVATNKGKITNLFTGIIRCNCCGGTMTLTPNGSAKSRGETNRSLALYLVCSNRRRKVTPCTATKYINYGWIEETILTNLPQIPWAKILKTERPDDPTLKLAEEIDAAETTVVALQSKVQNFTKAIGEGASVAPILEALTAASKELEAAEERLQSLRSQRSTLQGEATLRPTLMNTAITQRDALADLEGPALHEARARLSAALKGIVKGIFVDGENGKIQVWISEVYRMEWNAGKQPTVLHRFWIDHPTESVVAA